MWKKFELIKQAQYPLHPRAPPPHPPARTFHQCSLWHPQASLCGGSLAALSFGWGGRKASRACRWPRPRASTSLLLPCLCSLKKPSFPHAFRLTPNMIPSTLRRASSASMIWFYGRGSLSTPTPGTQKQKNHGLAQDKLQKLERCVVCVREVLEFFLLLV